MKIQFAATCARPAYRCTRPEALPPASASTSVSDAWLKSCSMVCLRQLAATAKLMAALHNSRSFLSTQGSSSAAGPGEIVASASALDQMSMAEVPNAEDLGDCYLKHVEAPVRAYRVRHPDDDPIRIPVPGSDRILPTLRAHR